MYTLDLSQFRHGTDEQRSRFARELCESFQGSGFVKLEGHGFDMDAVREMFEWNNRFFALPQSIRDSCAHVPGPVPQRGYSNIGGENLAKFHSLWTGEKPPSGRRDHKELFDVGPDEDVEYPNRWPQEDAIPGFRSYMLTTFRKFERLNAELLRALEVGMQLPPGTFTERCARGASEFRLVYYPALSTADAQNGKITRAWPHYDIGVLSFLFQDNVGGLEICDGGSEDAFVPVISERPTDLVVNVGETLHRWTNGTIKGGLHRVTTVPSIAVPDGEQIPQRRSVVFFAKADRTTSVAPLPALLDEAHTAKFDDLTFLEYHQQRIATAY